MFSANSYQPAVDKALKEYAALNGWTIIQWSDTEGGYYPFLQNGDDEQRLVRVTISADTLHLVSAHLPESYHIQPPNWSRFKLTASVPLEHPPGQDSELTDACKITIIRSLDAAVQAISH